MKQKTYPKVPNHYHDSVDETLFDAEDLVLLEKLDGSNARVMLYDERYAHLYGTEAQSVDPTDGDVLIGSKGTFRGVLDDPAESFDGNFRRLLTYLREHLDTDALRACHDDYDSPLLLFGEHMVKHSLDYEYDTNPPPAFLGFDVFKIREYEPPPANPFNETFHGFLSLDDAWGVFDQVGVAVVPIVDSNASSFDPEDFTVPRSEYRAAEAEGVVLRSDQRGERAKYVTAEFRERMQDAWGLREDEAESGAELFTARYLSNARFRKQVTKLIQLEGTGAVNPESVATAAVADAWEEELADIQDMSIGLIPADIYPRACDRAAEVLDTMQTNARLNDTSLDRLWETHQNTIDDPTLASLETDENTLTALQNRLHDASDVEPELVRALCSPVRIHVVAERLAAAADYEFDRWVIEDTHAALVDEVWYENYAYIANLSVELVPAAVSDALLTYVAEEIEARNDVDTTEKSEDWRPSPDEADPEGLGDLF